MSDDRKKIINDILRKKDGAHFNRYIEYIRFPKYKGLVKNSVINFDFPLTVLIGKNGLGKSSCLQAIFGAPHNYNVSNFWFSTEVDPIQEAGGERSCFVYAYKDHKNAQLLEVLKTRIKRKEDPDYWETSRPLKKYDMKMLGGKRNPAIEMNVEYFDFRSMLTAFDKYLYFGNPSKLKSVTKQDYLRTQAKKLKQVIGQGKIYNARNNKVQNKKPEDFTTNDIRDIKSILGKDYSSGKIVEHKLFDEWGYSIIYQTPSLQYSEAFAGSGESAISQLVYLVNRAPDNSLIILDEPEVSLHPGAQTRLVDYLLTQIRNKSLQIVLSTHSPVIADNLPMSAVKTFISDNGLSRIVEGLSSRQAFASVGAKIEKTTIYVEDILAKKLIEAALDDLGNDARTLFEIVFEPGGASNILQRIMPVLSRNESIQAYVFLDGDQNKGRFDITTLPPSETTVERLDQIILGITGASVKFYPDGGEGGDRVDQEIELRKNYIKYHAANVYFLNEETPEHLLWDNEGKGLVNAFVSDEKQSDDFFNRVKNVSPKAKIKDFADMFFSGRVDSVEDMFIAKLKASNKEPWEILKQTLSELM